MKSTFSQVTSITTVIVIILCAVYAMGIFGGENITHVRNVDYHDFTYTGNMVDGYFSGNGIIRFKNNDYYIGEFRGGRFDGEGTFIFADGTIYTGSFINGQADGEGGFIIGGGDEN